MINNIIQQFALNAIVQFCDSEELVGWHRGWNIPVVCTLPLNTRITCICGWS